MKINELRLINYRCYKKTNIAFKNYLTIIYGPNAIGKSTILESIHVLALTKPYKNISNNALIKFGEKEFLLWGSFEDDGKNKIVTMSFSENIKRIKLNNLYCKKISEYIGQINVIAYDPSDYRIFSGTPGQRRRFFDLIFCQISQKYLTLMNAFSKILKERNAILRRVKTENKKSDLLLLEVITEKLIEMNKIIITLRKKLINQINIKANPIHSNFTTEKEELKIIYNYNSDEKDIEDKIKSALDLDINSGNTSVGAQKDDYIFIINNKNIGYYASQGQMKTAIISIKLAFVYLIYEIKKTYPIVLLDDVFSELDKNRQNQLINILDNQVQTIITTTTISDIDEKLIKKAHIIELEKRGER